MRTTLDIETPILADVKRLQRRSGRSQGKIVSELLTEALAARRQRSPGSAPALRWVSRPMGARVDLLDKEAVNALLDEKAE